jgi:hypothetical protein
MNTLELKDIYELPCILFETVLVLGCNLFQLKKMHALKVSACLNIGYISRKNVHTGLALLCWLGQVVMTV